jgi:hypothetical protein
MPESVIDGFTRLTEEERQQKAGDIFQAEFRRQLHELPEAIGRKSFERWRSLSKDETFAMLDLITSHLGIGSITDVGTLSDHSKAITEVLLETLLDDEVWVRVPE